MKKKTLSCADLQHSLFAAPNELRHCCQRFFVDGKMKGDVAIFDVSSNEDISVNRILESKKKLIQQINNGEDNPCSGCPLIKKDHWEPLDKLTIKYLSVEPHSVCNLKCSYCSPIYYGGEKPTYDVLDLYDKLKEKDAFSKRISIVWGGGEPILLRSFDKVFTTLTSNLKPFYNNIFTNATFFNQTINKYLINGMVSITTSIDAGTKETYEIVRGKYRLHRVLANLKKYAEHGADNITIKYILLAENLSDEEVLAFVRLIKEFELTGCSFQISTDYKNESIMNDVIDAAMLMHEKLKFIGANFISFDEHIRGRISKKMKTKSYNKNKFSNIIIWGASEYAETLLRNSHFFKQNSISYFVDSNKDIVGKKINNYDIKSTEHVLFNDYPIFIGTAIFYREIFKELMSMGVAKDRIIEHILV